MGGTGWSRITGWMEAIEWRRRHWMDAGYIGWMVEDWMNGGVGWMAGALGGWWEHWVDFDPVWILRD